MGKFEVTPQTSPEQLRLFTRRVLRDIRALEQMIERGLIETGIRRIGAEQEMFLTDRSGRPAPVAMEVLEAIDDKRFSTELGRFNLEANIAPLELGGDCLSRLEQALAEVVSTTRAAADRFDADVVLTGILPTLRLSDLDLENMAPVPRYVALNQAFRLARGGDFELRVRGTDELAIKHDNVMLEACNASCQVHLQVSPQEFARFYNIAQVVTGPIMAAAANSPLLFGKRLWKETRIAVFEQSLDTRLLGHHIQERSARVSFGECWVRESVLEIYREQVARFRVFLTTEVDEDPLEILAAGGVPRLHALNLHNGTVYRWNRPCYGVRGGKAHLRIENRVLPAGPTVPDETANAALWIGMVCGLAVTCEDITERIAFHEARGNFVAAARHGLDTRLHWLDGSLKPADELIRGELLPLADRGLREAGLDKDDVDRYLGIIERRITTRNTGAAWQLRSLAHLGGRNDGYQKLRTLVTAMSDYQKRNIPVGEWEQAGTAEAGSWRHDYERIGQFMTTDIITVHQDEVIDLAASVMAWRSIRHVPVENDKRELVGLVSARRLLEYIARHVGGTLDPVPVREIMERDPVFVAPETPTAEALELMRQSEALCLPVVKNGRLVGIVSEHDFIGIAARALAEEGKASDEGKAP
jgi:CBS domain-containing protein